MVGSRMEFRRGPKIVSMWNENFQPYLSLFPTPPSPAILPNLFLAPLSAATTAPRSSSRTACGSSPRAAPGSPPRALHLKPSARAPPLKPSARALPPTLRLEPCACRLEPAARAPGALCQPAVLLLNQIGIERDIGSLQLEEKKLVAEIKRTAKTGNEAATKILACQLIRLRHQISNLQGSRAHTGGIATHTQAMHANTSVATGMKSVSKAMRALNKQMNPAKQMKVMQEFQKQSAQMDMSNEMMSDSIDNILDDDQAEEETFWMRLVLTLHHSCPQYLKEELMERRFRLMNGVLTFWAATRAVLSRGNLLCSYD